MLARRWCITLSFDAKPLLIAVAAFTGLGAVLYFVTRTAESRFAERRDNVVTDQLNAAQAGMATSDVNSALASELANVDGSRNVRSSVSGNTGLYYGDASGVASRQAARRSGQQRVGPGRGGNVSEFGMGTPPEFGCWKNQLFSSLESEREFSECMLSRSCYDRPSSRNSLASELNRLFDLVNRTISR